MKTKYNNHDLEITYAVEPGFWTFYLKIKVDEIETLRSMTYSLPDKLKIVSYFVESIPVRIIADDMPYIRVYWRGVSIGLDAKETVNIQSTLDYIRTYLP